MINFQVDNTPTQIYRPKNSCLVFGWDDSYLSVSFMFRVQLCLSLNPKDGILQPLPRHVHVTITSCPPFSIEAFGLRGSQWSHNC